MYCAISGVPPAEPVISRKSGHLFEKRLVLKALAASGGKCPATGDDLTEDDLIAVHADASATRALPASATSLPGLLSHMQAEWDAVALEGHALRQALATAHQELAAALYKYDAATRVIARVVRERDEAVAALADRGAALAAAGSSGAANGGGAAPVAGADVAPANGEGEDAAREGVMTEEEAAGEKERAERMKENTVHIVDTVLEQVMEKHAALTKMRSARKSTKTPGLVTAADVRAYVETASVEVVQGSSSCAALAVQVVPDAEKDGAELVAAGCSDGAIRIYNSDDLSPLGCGAVDAHVGAVTCLANDEQAQPGLLFSGGADGLVRGWKIELLQSATGSQGEERPKKRRQSRSAASKKAASTLTRPDPVIEFARGKSDAAVCGLSVHPTGKYVLSALESGEWRLHDTESAAVVGAGFAGSGAHRIDSCSLHPDGAIFAVGLASGAVEMWDVNKLKDTSTPVETLGGGDLSTGSAQTIRMSENGYYMIVAGAGFTRVWDLRVLKMTREARICDEGADVHGCGIALDWSGTYCAASTGNGMVRLFETRKLKPLADVGVGAESPDLPSGKVGIAWSNEAACAYASTGSGKLVRIGPPTIVED